MSGYPPTANIPQAGNLVSRWLMDEASGTRADIVGINTLADINTVGAGTGLSLAGIELDNSADFERDNDEHLKITNAAQSGLDITGDLTFSVWINPESASGGDMSIMAKRQEEPALTSYNLYWRDLGSTPKLEFLINDGSSISQSQRDHTFSTGVWVLLTVVYDASAGEVKFFVDGSKLGATVAGARTSIQANAAPFVIGTNNRGVQEPWDGLMNDALIWNFELTDANVSDLYDLYFVPLPVAGGRRPYSGLI